MPAAQQLHLEVLHGWGAGGGNVSVVIGGGQCRCSHGRNGLKDGEEEVVEEEVVEEEEDDGNDNKIVVALGSG